MQKKITYFFRCPNISCSIERVFNIIYNRLSISIPIIKSVVPRYKPTPLNILINLWYIHRYKTDINHITGDIHYCAIALPRKGLILTIHDLVLLENSKGLKLFILKLFWYKIPIERAQIVTCVSNFTAKKIIDLFPWAKEKIRVIYNPIDIKYKYNAKQFNKRCPIILFVGTRENKNLLRAIKSLSGISCELRIIGELSKEIKKQLVIYNINYTSVNKLSDNDMMIEYCNSDIVLFPSIYEGFGLPIIEAQAIGRIVITSNIEPMIEVSNGSTILVDPYSIESIKTGIHTVIDDDNKRNQLIQLGLKNIERFSAELISTQYLKIYKEIM